MIVLPAVITQCRLMMEERKIQKGISLYELNIPFVFFLRKCVSYCPVGYFTDNINKKCEKCHQSCFECNGPGSTDCTNCDKMLLKLDTRECVPQCSIEFGYFQSK